MSDDNKDDDNVGTAAGDDAKASDDSHAAAKTPDKKVEDKKTPLDVKSTNNTDGFSADYVKKIREEAKEHRTKAKELETKLADAQKEIDTLGRNTLEKTNKLNSAIEKRLINAELKVWAEKNGLVDADAFKMVDLSGVKLSDDGDVIGLNELLEGLKANKPYLFKSATSANPNAKPPIGDSSGKDKPVYKTDAEANEACAKFLASL